MKARADGTAFDRPPHEPASRQQTQLGKAASGPRQLQQGQQIAQLTQATTAPNKTGLPDNLRSGIEALSGMDMSAVRVHRNSDKPAALLAHAYAQGSEIHLGPGQEKHLPHEAWHVVQQAQGRVRPTKQYTGVALNVDEGLEKEADRMGTRAKGGPAGAAQLAPQAAPADSTAPSALVGTKPSRPPPQQPVAQLKLKKFTSDSAPEKIDAQDKELWLAMREALQAYEVTSELNFNALAAALEQIWLAAKAIDNHFDDEDFDAIPEERTALYDWAAEGRTETTREMKQIIAYLPILNPSTLDHFKGGKIAEFIGELMEDEPEIPGTVSGEIKGQIQDITIAYENAQGLAFLPGQPPKVEDVRQGLLGDCWLLAPLISLVNMAQGRERIRQMIQPNDGMADVYTVTLYRPDGDDGLEPYPIQVPARFPARQDDAQASRFIFSSAGRLVPSGAETQTAPLWPALIEKAFAKHLEKGYAGLTGNTDGATATFETILGHAAPTDQPRAGHLMDKENLIRCVAQGKLVVVSTGTHYWSVLQADANTCTLRNPHGFTEQDTSWESMKKYKTFAVHDLNKGTD